MAKDMQLASPSPQSQESIPLSGLKAHAARELEPSPAAQGAATWVDALPFLALLLLLLLSPILYDLLRRLGTH